MSGRAGALKSYLALALLAVLALALSLSALLLGLGLSERLDASNFGVEPTIVPYSHESARALRVSPLNSRAYSEAEFEDFTKKMLTEYVVRRYTVNGSEYLMERAFGLKKDSAGGVPMKVLSSADAYAKFKEDEAPGVLALMSAKTTRAVRILGEPQRHPDGQWIVRAEFVYREPSTDGVGDARREYWDIRMEIDEVRKFREFSTALLEFGPTLYEFPSLVFGFRVNWLGKYESARR
jgi:hypothetical protein